MKTKTVDVEWERGEERGSLMIRSDYRACIANYFRNAKGTVTAMGKEYATVRGAERAIERAFGCRVIGRKK